MASEVSQAASYRDQNQTSSLLAKLNDQRSHSRFCDVVLKVCGEQIYAHSNVLAAASDYFGAFLGQAQDWPRAFSQKTPQIIEIYIDTTEGDNGGYGEAVRKVVDFMYTSEINLTNEIINQVLEISKIMQMDQIMEFCSRFEKADYGLNEKQGDAVPKITIGTMTDYERTDETENEFLVNIGSLDETEVDDVTRDPDYEAHIKLQQNNQKKKRGRGRPRKIQEQEIDDCSSEPNTHSLNINDEEDQNLCVFFTDSSEMDVPIPSLENNDETEAGKSPDSVDNDEVLMNDEESKENESVPVPKVIVKTEPSSPEPRYSRRVRKVKERPDYITPDLTKVKKPDEETLDVNKKPIQSYETSQNLRFMCKKCGFIAYKFSEYTSHKLSEHGSDNPVVVPVQVPRKEFKCDKCDFVTKKQPEFREHSRNHLHYEMICSFCEFQAESKVEFESHVLRHTGALPFFCLNCDVRFKNKAQLNAHLPKHSVVKPFVCNLCNAGFKWKHALKSHMIVHCTTKDHLCDICGFATAHKSMLKAHKLIHSGNTYKCEFHNCTFQATKKQNLKYHMLTHSGEKPHQCEICGQSFSLVKNMKRHKLMHSSHKPIKCDVVDCQFGTTRYDKLKEHKLKQHGSGEPPNKKLRLSDYQTLAENSQIIHITEGQLNEALAATQNIPEGQIIATVDHSGLIGVQYAEIDNAAEFIQYVTSMETT